MCCTLVKTTTFYFYCGHLLYLDTAAIHFSVLIFLSDFSFFLITETLSFVFSFQGHGSVIQMYPGGGPVRAGMESFGFPLHFHETLHEFPLCKVNALLSGTLNVDEKETDSANNGQSEEQPAAPSSGSSESQSMEVSTDPAEAKKMEEREKLREQKVSLLHSVYEEFTRCTYTSVENVGV